MNIGRDEKLRLLSLHARGLTEEERETAVHLPDTIIRVYVTAWSGENSIRWEKSLRLWHHPDDFEMKFAVAKSDHPSELPMSICEVYPNQFNENSHSRRTYLERFWRHKDLMMIVDSDPMIGPTGLSLNPHNGLGIQSTKLHPPQYAFLLRFLAWYSKMKFDAAYAGPNPSSNNGKGAQSLVLRPFSLDGPVSNAALILQPMRHLVPNSLKDRHLEWLVASCVARAHGKRTTVYRAMRLCFDIQPPKNVAEELEKIWKEYPQFRSGNMSPTSNGQKTRCIVHLRGQRTFPKEERMSKTIVVKQVLDLNIDLDEILQQAIQQGQRHRILRALGMPDWMVGSEVPQPATGRRTQPLGSYKDPNNPLRRLLLDRFQGKTVYAREVRSLGIAEGYTNSQISHALVAVAKSTGSGPNATWTFQD